MYIFISHSSRDKQFVRRLADSLAFYGIPIFFDEREIKVGDNIPAKIYDGLERATHVIYVLSKNSIQSEWVKEELSVAKMRQMNKAGCLILPVLIDDISPPVFISHIRYANFTNWTLKEYYIQAFQELLVSLDIKLQYSSSTELLFFQKHINYVAKTMAFASSATQTFFQLEKLWFDLFDRDFYKASNWFDKCVSKTWDIDSFRQVHQTFANGFVNLGLSSERTQKILELFKKIENDYKVLSDPPDAMSDQAYYDKVWRAEVSANELLAILYSIILELQGVLVPPKIQD